MTKMADKTIQQRKAEKRAAALRENLKKRKALSNSQKQAPQQAEGQDTKDAKS